MSGLKLKKLVQWLQAFQSHPIRMSGLKWQLAPNVAAIKRSHPIRMSGLKLLVLQQNYLDQGLSHPIRMSGLKFVSMESVEKYYTSLILYG